MMDQRDKQDGIPAAEQFRQQQRQGEDQQQLADTGQASYGNSGEDPDQLGQGQSSAGQAGHDQSDMMTQEDRGSEGSTSAQRSGGQTEGGQGMGNESFAGSSLGGQASPPDPAAAMFNGEPPADGGDDEIDPTTGQPSDKADSSDLDGQ